MRNFLFIQSILFCGLTFKLLRGEGSSAVWVLVYVLIQLFGVIFFKTYRRGYLKKFDSAFTKLKSYKRGDPYPLASAAYCIFLPFVLLYLSNGGAVSSLDNHPLMQSAASIVTDGDINLIEYVKYPQRWNAGCLENMELPYYLRCTKRGVLSAYPLGMLVFVLPTVVISKLLGAHITDWYTQWRIAAFLAAVLSALSLCGFLGIALELTSPKAAYLSAVLLGTGSVFFSTLGQGLWSHLGVIVGLLGFLFIEIKKAKEKRGGFLLQAFFLSLSFCSRPASAPLLVCLGVFSLIKNGVRSLYLIPGVVLFCAPLSMLYFNAYGHWLGPQFLMASDTRWFSEGISPIGWLLWSYGRGVFVYQPILFLLFVFGPAFKGPSRGRTQSSYLLLFVALFVVQLILVGGWSNWYGGSCYGSRLLSEGVVFLFLILSIQLPYWMQTKARLVLLVFLAVCGFGIHAIGVYVPGPDYPANKIALNVNEQLNSFPPPFVNRLFR